MKQTVTLGAHLLPTTDRPTVALVERWEKGLGETVLAGEILAVLQVGNITVSIPSPAFGVLAKRCVLPGEAIDAGEPVAVLSGVPVPAADTGPISEAFAAPPAYIPAGPEETVTLSKFDIAVADHQARSLRDTPHAHVVTTADVTEALRFIERTARGETVSGLAESLSLLPFVLSATAASLHTFRALNAQLVQESEIRQKQYVHIGIEQRNTSGHLSVPVIQNADRKSVLALAREIADFTARSNQGQLKESDVSGATFTVSEAPKVLYRTPILHHPLAGHLCFGKPVNGQIYLCLAHDARIVHSDTASDFLADVAQGLSESRFLFA